MTLMNTSDTPSRIRVTESVRLEKSEIFVLCEALALTERSLIRAGLAREATMVGSIFDPIEARLMVRVERERDMSPPDEKVAV
jgi:hypothetical protein